MLSYLNMFLMSPSSLHTLFSSSVGLTVCLLASHQLQFMMGRLIQAVFRVSNILIQVCLSEDGGQLQLGNRFATLAAVQAVAFVIGPIVGGQLAEQDKRLPVIISCLLCICNIFVQFFVQSNIVSSNDKSTIRKKNDDEVDSCSDLLSCCIPEKEPVSGDSIYKKREFVDAHESSVVLKRWMTAEYVFIFHVKMFFTFANSIYESIFTQHMLSQLNLEGSSIGWMLGYVGLATAFSNAFVVKSYSLLIRRHNFALVCAAIFHAVGILSWATTSVVRFSMLASATAFCIVVSFFISFISRSFRRD